MVDYHPNLQNKVFLFCDSKGSQTKYKDNNFWYKVDMLGKEGQAEHLSSLILSCSDIMNVEYVDYNVCKIDDKTGCVSANFLNDGESFISLRALYKNIVGGEISEKMMFLKEEDRVPFIIDFTKDNTNLDITEYLSACITLDYLILNPDRHFGNLGIIRRSDGSFKFAPIFDNGQGLGQNYLITPPTMSYNCKKDSLSAGTVCGSFQKALDLVNGPFFKINYVKLNEKLKDEPSSTAKDFLMLRLNELNKILNLSNDNPFSNIFDKFEEEIENEYY